MKRNWVSFTRKLDNNKNALLILILSVGMVSFFLLRPSYGSVLGDDVAEPSVLLPKDAQFLQVAEGLPQFGLSERGLRCQ